MEVYQEVVNSQEPAQQAPSNPFGASRHQPAPPAVAEQQAPSNPFGASRHQPPEQLAQQPQAAGEAMEQEASAGEAQWFMAGGPSSVAATPSVEPPVVSNGSSVAQMALQAAVAASSRSIDALVRARNELEKQIEQERRSHLQLVNLVEQAKRQGGA